MRAVGITATVEEHVVAEIRNAILEGELEPGARLKLRDLATELGVSVVPVRSALTELRGEGLVRYSPRSGSIVAPLEYEDFEELQARRLGLESLAARLGAERMNELALRRMVTQLAAVDRVAGGRDLEHFLRAESEFRATCYRCSGRDRLVSEVRDYRARAERYLRVAVASPPALRRSVDFQHKLLEACRRKDGRMAERETRKAIEWTKELLAETYVPEHGRHQAL